MQEISTDTQVVEKPTQKIKPPQMFDVVFYNDNKTYYQFVVLVLMQFYNKDLDTATQLTNLIHEHGKHAVATFTYEIAAAKRDETVSTARANGHPLRVELEARNDI
jgi:ATP-dependent Clp protease adaptor protein ClpS